MDRSARSEWRRALITAVITGTCIAVGAALNAVTVATASWVYLTIREHSDIAVAGVIHGKGNIGLWRFCVAGPNGHGECAGFTSDVYVLTEFDFPTTILGPIYIARVLSISAAALCLISIPMAMAGFAAKNMYLVIASGAIFGILQFLALSIGLVIFGSAIFFAAPDNVVLLIDVYPGWSSALGVLSALLYLVGGILLCVVQVLLIQLRRRRGTGHVTENTGGLPIPYVNLREDPDPSAYSATAV